MVAVFAIKTELCQEPIAGRFKPARVFSAMRAISNTVTAIKAVKRARVHAVRDIVMFCAMMILFYAVYNREPGVYMVCLGALFSVCYNVFANGLWAGRVLPAFILDKVGKIFRVRSTYIGL